MGRVIRRLVRRIKYFGIGVVFSAAIYHRWQYRRSAVVPWQQGEQSIKVAPINAFSSMTVDNPFDVLVVGGNLIALYTAVDAAQRGLRVALIAEHDFNAEMNVETVLPGAFPFMQKAIRQRDWRIFCQGLQALAAFTTWLNVAPFCIDKHTEDCLLSSSSQINSRNVAKKVNVEKPTELEQEHHIKTLQKECKHTSTQRWHLFRSFPAVKTYVPAMSLTELSEFMFAAMVSTIISPLYGPWRPCTVVWPYKARKCINMKEDFAQGGVIAHDCAFDANKATLALLRTAEALGVALVNYTSVESFEYCNTQGEDGESNTSETVNEHSPAAIIRANVHVHSTDKHINQSNECKVNKNGLHMQNKKEADTFMLPVYTRGVINCAGNEADRIKALVPNNEKEIIPFAYDSYMAYSYLVTPRSAINFCSQEQQKTHQLCDKNSTRWIDKIDAFMTSSTRFILRPTCMLLPWYDNCILIGPYTHFIEGNEERAERTKEKALTAHKYDNEVNEITTMCKYAGVEVDKTQILSCLTSFMPVLRRAEALPWLKEVVQKGYHIDISSKHSATDDDGVISSSISSTDGKELLLEQFNNTKNRQSNKSTAFDAIKDTNAMTQISKRMEVSKLDAQPFIHLYGGMALFARDIAEELVNTYLDNTCALSDAQQQALCKPCATRYLGLLPPSQELVELTNTSKLQNTHKESHPLGPPTSMNTHITHLSDLVLRRWHIGYTSPAEAIRALPVLAEVLQSKLGWDAQRTAVEIDDAYDAIMASAVTHKSMARN